MNLQSIKEAITPLRMIFWGGLLCILDITLNFKTTEGWGFKCDILDDTVGMILITVGVFRLRAIPVHQRYATLMKFVQILSVLNLLDSIRAHFVVPLPAVLRVVLDLSA
jgi:hypothetical protein